MKSHGTLGVLVEHDQKRLEILGDEIRLLGQLAPRSRLGLLTVGDLSPGKLP